MKRSRPRSLLLFAGALSLALLGCGGGGGGSGPSDAEGGGEVKPGSNCIVGGDVLNGCLSINNDNCDHPYAPEVGGQPGTAGYFKVCPDPATGLPVTTITFMDDPATGVRVGFRLTGEPMPGMIHPLMTPLGLPPTDTGSVVDLHRGMFSTQSVTPSQAQGFQAIEITKVNQQVPGVWSLGDTIDGHWDFEAFNNPAPGVPASSYYTRGDFVGLPFCPDCP